VRIAYGPYGFAKVPVLSPSSMKPGREMPLFFTQRTEMAIIRGVAEILAM
jgi:hypothetical protein